MGFTATKPESNYQAPPAGMYIARCYSLIDLGTQPKMYQGQVTGEARKIRIGFELFGDEQMDDGRPFTISKNYTLSMHENATLRAHLESWRGRPFTQEEEMAFDVSKLLGAYCMLNVMKEKGADGNDYTVVGAVTPMMKGMTKPEPVNENFIFDADEPDMELFEKLGDKTKELIRNCREWKMKDAGHRPATTATPAGGTGFDDLEDDIPF
jgi:hypothetical protein